MVVLDFYVYDLYIKPYSSQRRWKQMIAPIHGPNRGNDTQEKDIGVEQKETTVHMAKYKKTDLIIDVQHRPLLSGAETKISDGSGQVTEEYNQETDLN